MSTHLDDQSNDLYAAIQQALDIYVAQVHDPIIALLAQSPEDRDHARIPVHIHELDSMVTWLSTDVLGKVPMQMHDNVRRATLNLRDELGAVHQNVLNNRPIHQPRETIARPQGGYMLALNLPMLVQLTEEGFTDQEIADHLGCSRHTVIRRRQALAQTPKRQAKHQVPEEVLWKVSPHLALLRASQTLTASTACT